MGSEQHEPSAPVTRRGALGRRLAPMLAFALLAAGCGESERRAAEVAPVALQGQVVAGEGAPVGGVAVIAKAANGIESTVFAGADGRFSFAALPDGDYTLRAHHASWQPGAAQVSVKGGTAATATLQLAPAADPTLGMTSAQWLSLLPAGDMRQEFILNCASCHEIGASRILVDGKPRDRDFWFAAIKMMRGLDAYNLTPPDFDDRKYADWLAEHLSAERIATLKPAPTRADLAGKVTITEYPVPKADELPHDLVVGPDRRIWITGFWTSQMWALTPETGAIQSFDVNAQPDVVGQLRALEFDRNGTLWMLLGGTKSVVALDPKSGSYRTYPVDMYAHDIDIDSKGDIWFNDYFAKRERIGRLSVADGKVQYFDLPSANLTAAQGLPLPYGMQIDSKDRLWSTQLAANTLALYDIPSGTTKQYEMPMANSGPRRTAIGLDGSVWIPEWNTGTLTRFNPETAQFQRHGLGNPLLGAYDVEVDPRTGVVWVTGSLNSSMVRFDPATGTQVEIPLPTEPAYNRHIAIDPANGDVWLAYSSLPTAVPKVARIRYSP